MMFLWISTSNKILNPSVALGRRNLRLMSSSCSLVLVDNKSQYQLVMIIDPQMEVSIRSVTTVELGIMNQFVAGTVLTMMSSLLSGFWQKILMRFRRGGQSAVAIEERVWSRYGWLKNVEFQSRKKTPDLSYLGQVKVQVRGGLTPLCSLETKMCGFCWKQIKEPQSWEIISSQTSSPVQRQALVELSISWLENSLKAWMLVVPTKSTSVIILSQMTCMIQSMMTNVMRVMRKKVSASLREKDIRFLMFVLIWVVTWFTCYITFCIYYSLFLFIIVNPHHYHCIPSSTSGHTSASIYRKAKIIGQIEQQFKIVYVIIEQVTMNSFINKSMSLEDKDFQATEYARNRVEEIKRKVAASRGSSISKENDFPIYSSAKRQSIPRNQNQHDQSDKPREALGSIEPKQYENRIKNIEDINVRIKAMLASEKTRPSKGYRSSNKTSPLKISKEMPPTTTKFDLVSDSGKTSGSERKKTLADFTVDTISVEYKSQKTSHKDLFEKDYQKQNYVRIEKKGETQKTRDKQNFIKKQTTKQVEVNKTREKKETPQPRENGRKQVHRSPEKSTGSKETMKLAGILSEQILLDQKFRQAKGVFAEWDKCDKWEILLKKYSTTNSGSISMEEAKTIFQICSEQHNPFFETPASIAESCIDDLLLAHKQASQFWKRKADECVEIKKLERQFFSVQDLDLNRKGYISVEDLVCFVNLYTGNFFRNRDVVSLFKRFTRNSELKYESFLEKVTK